MRAWKASLPSASTACRKCGLATELISEHRCCSLYTPTHPVRHQSAMHAKFEGCTLLGHQTQHNCLRTCHEACHGMAGLNTRCRIWCPGAMHAVQSGRTSLWMIVQMEEDFRGLETALKSAHTARDSAYRAAGEQSPSSLRAAKAFCSSIRARLQHH